VVVGSIDLLPVADAVGLLGEYSELYPEVPVEAWEPYRALYPDLFSGYAWRLPCNCFLVRTEEITILVDTGVGPPGLWDWTAENEGELPASLAKLGLGPRDIDIVFLTHLHIDHLGWNTDLEGIALFPSARYVVHEDALTFVRAQEGRAHVQRCIIALEGRFETVSGDFELAPGVSAFAAPGHFPGHMGLRFASEGQRAVLIADTAVHPALLNEPDWVYVADGEPAICAATRNALLPELIDQDVLVACGHYPGSGIGRVVTHEGRVVWEEAG